MTYFNSRDIAAIAMCAALWGVLNSIFSPIVFSITHLPILCDLIGFTILTVAAWWIRKFGAITAIGFIATIINFIFNPQALTFLGFTAAAFVFDLIIVLVGFNNFFKRALNTSIIATIISTLSAAIAGFIIGSFFMATPALSLWGGVSGWAGLHAVGGIVGGAMGATLVASLNSRKIMGNDQMIHEQKKSLSLGGSVK